MFCQKIGLQVRLCWTWLESSCFADVDLPCQEKTQIGTGVFWLVQPIRAFPPISRFFIPGLIQFKTVVWECLADLGVLIMMQTQECEGHGFGSKMGPKNGDSCDENGENPWESGGRFQAAHGQDGPNAGVRDCRQHVRHRRDFALSRESG